ncbi:hypothetical protein DL89DRAFT_23152 [Linderina pennispora]|uniref:Molybdopterin cofactor biosynthesis C (MoaC) domain-containing protein n=1 Tax=Linderina pennispora TaxID=61395 RepID=A0A1Y1WNV1_9FUNG|nr:uncharacterized protein DL89DRAFT_23152 [Linderina pennispora]ORX74814.1 hypothetical protein DL89DRAFT_23152 [Linderina pennispora]
MLLPTERSCCDFIICFYQTKPCRLRIVRRIPALARPGTTVQRQRRLSTSAWHLSNRLTHVDESGEAHMVDVSAKTPTLRTAVARGRVLMNKETFDLIKQDGIKKGNVLTVAQIAGIQGAKKLFANDPALPSHQPDQGCCRVCLG